MLIALPITALTAGMIFFESHQQTQQQKVDYRLGHADSRIWINGGPNDTKTQALDEPGMSQEGEDTGPPPTEFPSVIPAAANTVEVTSGVSVLLPTSSGATWLPLIAGPVWEDRFDGVATLLSGSAPSAPDEALATPAALERLGLSVGDTITVEAGAEETPTTVTITGTVDALELSQNGAGGLAVPSDSVLIGQTYDTSWFVFGWQPTLTQLVGLNHEGYVVLGHDLMLRMPAYPGQPFLGSSDRASAYALGLIGGAFIAVLVGLVAAAAMTVSARRQQRSLAMAASVGAGRGSLFAVVLGQGVVLGLLAAAVGIGLGTAAAAVALAVLDNGNPWTIRGNWGFHVPLAPLLAIAIFAVIVGTVAAIGPARAATRGDTLAALRGARRPVRLRQSMPRWGAVVLGTGLACGIAAIVFLSVKAAAHQNLTAPEGIVTTALSLLGPIIIIVGTALCGHWLLTVLARSVSRAGIATRVATRDLAANPSRTVPAFLAIAAAMLVTVAALSVTSMTSAASVRAYTWNAPLHTVTIGLGGVKATTRAAGAAEAEHLLRVLNPTRIAVVDTARLADVDSDGVPVDPDQMVVQPAAPISQPSDCDHMLCVDGWGTVGVTLRIVSAADLPTVAGTTLTDAERAAYESGTAIVSDDMRWMLSDDDGPHPSLRLFSIPAAEAAKDVTSQVVTDGITSRDVPALLMSDLRGLPGGVVLSPQSAAALHIDHDPSEVFGAMSRTLTAAESDRLVAGAAESPDADLYAHQENGPGSALPWLALIAGIALSVVVGTAVVTLGLARFERRPDDATLTAVGGRSGIRRRVNAVQALAVVGLGCVIGAGIGLLPSFAYYALGGAPHYRPSDIPWLWIIGVAVALPLAMAAVAWLVAPRNADLTRRTAIT